MRREKRDAAYLWDMLKHAQEVAMFLQGRTAEEYHRDLLLRRAIERCVSIIGEAAGRVSKAFREAHPEIPWHAIVAQRHRLVHEYDHITDEKIWRVATIHVPILIAALGPLIPEPPPDPLPED
jgi:uncharacterized protein with HEPN domain